MQTGSEYFGARQLIPPPTVVYVSGSLEGELKIVLMLSLIESLWWSLDEAQL